MMRRTVVRSAVVVSLSISTAACSSGASVDDAGSLSSDPLRSSAAPSSAATAAPDLLLAADFDRGPDPFTVTTTPGYSLDIENGTYRFRILTDDEGVPNGTYAYLVREAPAVTVSVDVVELTSPTAGDDLVGVGCTDDNGDGYFLQAGTYFFVTELSGGHFRSVKGMSVGETPDAGKVERLRLTCMGATRSSPAQLRASINDVEVASVTDPDGFDAFTTIALRLSADPDTEARFDNVVAQVPQPADSR